MGFFDEVKKAAAGAKDGFAQAGEAIGNAKQGWTDAVAAQNEAQAAQREAFAQQLKIIDATPDDELARINAGDGPGRAVVMGVSHNLEDGESVLRTNATAYIRMRLADGLGPEQKLKLWIDSGTIRSLRAGSEIPVQYDRATGLIVDKPDMKAIAADVKAKKKSGGF
jgi:hypothetical protein